MNEATQILFMQTRLVRLASSEWKITIRRVNEIFQKYDVFHYIANYWGIFHTEGDAAVLDDINSYIRHKDEMNG